MWKAFNKNFLKTDRVHIWIDSRAQKRFLFGLVKHYSLVLMLMFFFVYSYPFVEWFSQLTAHEHRVALHGFLIANASKWPLLLVVLGVFVLYGIMLSHKIFGPVLKLKKHLYALRSGRLTNPLYFRDGDYFQELVDPVNDFQTQVRQSLLNIRTQLMSLSPGEKSSDCFRGISDELAKYTLDEDKNVN